MNATQLLAQFDRLVEAPDAVPRLRRFILDLAVRGKLVEQHSGDEPAATLLTQVSAEWTRLQKEGAGKKGKDVTKLAEKDGPFALPSLWQFVCLGEVLQMFNGRAFKPTEWLDHGIRIIRIQNLNNPSAPFNFCDPVTVDERHLVKNGDFLISWSGTPGTSFGAFIWERGEGALNQHIFRCVQVGNAYEPRFLRLAINTQLNVLISQAKGGVGLQHVTKGTLEKLPLALPPFDEQRRIIAKVEELLTLCDQLETAQQEREDSRARLAVASIQRLKKPAKIDNPETRREYARFHLENLPRITTRPEHIAALRRTILNLAIFGALVEQDRDDEPASQLLKRIASKRSQIFETEGARRKKAVNLTYSDASALPPGWSVEALANLVDPLNTLSYGVLVPGADVEDGVPFVRVQDLKLAGHPPRPNKSISPEVESAYSRTRLKGGEILLCVVGSTIGKLGVAPSFWAGANIARAICRISPMSELNKEYLLILLQSSLAQEFFAESTRTLAQPTLNVGLIEQLPILVPPLAEQRRIVAKVDELMLLCDQLETQLTITKTDSGQLLENLLDQALGVMRVSTQKKRHLSPSIVTTSDHKKEKASYSMASTPITTVDQFIDCIGDLGGIATPERLLKHVGLSEDIETFYDLLREARDSRRVAAPLGSGEVIRRPVNAD